MTPLQSARKLLKLVRNLPISDPGECFEACRVIPLLAHEAGVNEALALQACKALYATIHCADGELTLNSLVGEAGSALWDLETNLLHKLNISERSHSKHRWL